MEIRAELERVNRSAANSLMEGMEAFDELSAIFVALVLRAGVPEMDVAIDDEDLLTFRRPVHSAPLFRPDYTEDRARIPTWVQRPA